MDCKECQAMRTASKEHLNTRQKCSVLKVLIIALAAVLTVAVLSGAYLFDKHMSTLENLLSGATICEDVDFECGEHGAIVYDDNNSTITGNENEVQYGSKDTGSY